MKKDYCKLFLVSFFLFGFLLGFDIWLKFFVDKNIPLMGAFFSKYPCGGIAVFNNVFGINFSINHVANLGAAWGLFSKFSKLLLFFRIGIVLGLLIYVIGFLQEKKKMYPLMLILFGAIGNILDFFFYGHVIDMFHFNFWGYSFPLFNIADSMICVGIGWLFLLSVMINKKRAKESLL